MVKSLKVEKPNGISIIEINKDELKNIVDAVEYMADNQKRKLLENLPSNEGERKRLDNYNALKENLKSVLKSLL
jgi:vacuolar-type H+-ATPase subunit F/Vma7